MDPELESIQVSKSFLRVVNKTVVQQHFYFKFTLLLGKSHMIFLLWVTGHRNCLSISSVENRYQLSYLLIVLNIQFPLTISIIIIIKKTCTALMSI